VSALRSPGYVDTTPLAVALFVLLFGVYGWRIATQPPAPRTAAGHDSASGGTDLVPISPPVEEKAVVLDGVSYSPAESALRFQADLGSLPVEGRPVRKEDKSSENWHWTYTIILEGAGKDLDGNKLALSSRSDPERPARFYFQASHITLPETEIPKVRLMVTDGEDHTCASSPLTAIVRNSAGVVGADSSGKPREPRHRGENDASIGNASGRWESRRSKSDTDTSLRRRTIDRDVKMREPVGYEREPHIPPAPKPPDRVTSPDF
jgi:hypothetical protein